MDAIVVIVDRFTKIIQLKITMMNISSEEIAKIYSDEVWKLHGIPIKFLVTEDHNLHRSLWRNSQKH